MSGPADAIHHTIIGQADLVTSLAVAVIGGLLALLMQTKHLRANHPTRCGGLLGLPWYFWSLGLAGISVTLGILISGMMIQVAPILFGHEFNIAERFSTQDFGETPLTIALPILAAAQQLLFLLSVSLAVVVVYKNKD